MYRCAWSQLWKKPSLPKRHQGAVLNIRTKATLRLKQTQTYLLDPQVDNVSLTVKKSFSELCRPFLNNKTCRGGRKKNRCVIYDHPYWLSWRYITYYVPYSFNAHGARKYLVFFISLFFSIGQGHWSFWMKRIFNGQAVFATAPSQNKACFFFYVSNQQMGVICQHYRKIGPEWEFKAGSMIFCSINHWQ